MGNVLQLLSVDVHAEPSELTHRLIYWLYSCRAIQEVTKPAEMAFSIPQIYYHYVDQWEARVLGDPHALNDRVQLGRQLFSDATVDGVNVRCSALCSALCCAVLCPSLTHVRFCT